MPTNRKVSRLSVSVYLLKQAKAAEARKQVEAISETTYRLTDAIPHSDFFVLHAEVGAPKWLKPMSVLLAGGESPEITGQSPGALLWVPRTGKTFVFTFGYGHTKVKSEWVVPDFGKVVALSVVPQGQVREVRAEQVFAKRHIASERAPTASAVSEFGFEPDRDMVAAVEGVPEDKYQATLGTKVRGGTALKFDLVVKRLINALDQIIERYDSNDHRRRWPQANNLLSVDDSELINQLDAKLGVLLAGVHPEQLITLSAPGESSGDKPYPQHFVIGNLTATPATSPYLTFSSWEGFLKHKGLTMSLQSAHSTKVHLLDEDKEEIGSCGMYQCLATEISLNRVTYVLSSGTWYKADIKFIAHTNNTLSSLAEPQYTLSKWNEKDHEGAYNEAACAADSTLWLFDKKLLSFGGGASRLEFCDIMHLPTQTLYFVKHPAGSAGVSHLCEQVRRTAEAFFSPDPSYRNKLADKIAKTGKKWSTTWLTTRPKRHEWSLCLVLMGKEVKELPFFAKCGIARLLGELQRGGYNVSFQAV